MEQEVTFSITVSWILHNFISISNAYENLALFTRAWQSHTYQGGGGPQLSYSYDSRTLGQNVVNGYKSDLSRWSGHCAISKNNVRAATLWVNLTSIRNIHHIKIYYRTENNKWGQSNHYTARFLGFYLYVSNTTNRNDGYLCFHDTMFTRATIPPVVNIACPVYGQFVIYYNERLEGVKYPSDYSTYAFTEVCEIEVYGCTERHSGGKCPEYCGDCPIYKQCSDGDRTCKKVCPVGFYGTTCERNCSSHCLYSNRCDSKSGICQEGCKAGWKGPLCDTGCDSNEYGRNCSTYCGHCREGSECNKTDGSCASGCAAGYTGKTCTEECGVGFYGLDCKQKCSTYCNVSGVCDHVTGSCKDGCKRGWQGMDCLEIKIKDIGKTEIVNTVSDCSQTLYVFIVLFCVGVLAIILLSVYIIHLRMNLQSMISNCQVSSDKALTVESSNPKEKTYDTIGIIAGQGNGKPEETAMISSPTTC